MHTKDKLAQALDEVGLFVMAEQARTGYYHDFMSPLDTPELVLLAELRVASEDPMHEKQRRNILALRKRVMNGDFDASTEEGEEWAASEEGQEAFRKLTR